MRVAAKNDFILKLIVLIPKFTMVENKMSQPTLRPDEATINRAKLFLYKAIAENRLDNIKRILDAQFPIEEEVGPGGLTLLMHCT
jgi:hypothetical protein